MPVANRGIHLNVPVEMAFRYLLNPTHLPEICPNVVTVAEIHQETMRTTCFSWSYKMIGVHFQGRAEIREIQHNQQIDIHFWGGLRGNLTWDFSHEEDGARLEAIVDYTFPTPLLHKHPEERVIEDNERAVETMLATLKTLLELQVIAQSPN